MIDIFIITSVVCLVGIVGAWFILRFFERRRQLKNLDLRVLLIKIPRTEAGDKNDFFKEINLSEQLFVTLSSINQPFCFEVSVPNFGEEIRFYLAVPRRFLDFAKREIQGLFLDAKVEEASDYTIFDPQSSVSAGYLMLEKSYALPITTYRESEVDVFSPILSTFSRLAESGEGASLQFLIEPAGESTKRDILKTLERLKKGENFSEITRKDFISLKDVKNEFVNGEKDPLSKEDLKIDEEAIKAVQLKLSKSLFKVNARIVVSAVSSDRAEDLFLSVANALSKIASPIRNSFKIIKPKKIKNLIFNYIFRNFDDDQAFVLNIEELASIFHLPTKSSDVPNINWLKTKEAPPPETLPKEGLILGDSVFRDTKKTIRLTDDDRRRHLYIIGQTGTGKSTLITNLAVQDMKNGKGVCVVDPHGELIDSILALTPLERIDDVVIFNPGDLERPLGLNLLEYDPNRPEEKTFIVNELQSIFNQLFSQETMGPMFEKYMRNSLLLLMEDKTEIATLMEVPRIFTDQEFRERKLAQSTNPTVIDFWTKEVPKVTGEAGLGNMAPYITSKFDNFISNDYLRPIIGQTKSAINFRQAMDEGKIILVNLSKGKIGDINSSLIGMVIVGKILQSALSRADIPEKDRRDFYLYIDEFQNYTTNSIATILSEARKYRLNLTVAHQHISQLKDNIRDAVFGNIGNLVAFRVGVPDTEILSKHFNPNFDERDLISIENLNAHAKILIQGEPSKPFNFKFTWTEGGSKDIAEKLKELSRLKYGIDREEVENLIKGHLKD